MYVIYYSEALNAVQYAKSELYEKKSGCIILISFYETRVKSMYLGKFVHLILFLDLSHFHFMIGFASKEEKVYFEKWKIPLIFDDRILPLDATDRTPNRYEQIRNVIQQRICYITDRCNEEIEHVPTTNHSYEIVVDRLELKR